MILLAPVHALFFYNAINEVLMIVAKILCSGVRPFFLDWVIAGMLWNTGVPSTMCHNITERFAETVVCSQFTAAMTMSTLIEALTVAWDFTLTKQRFVKSLIGALTEMHNTLSFVYSTDWNEKSISFVLDGVQLQNLSIRHGKEGK